MGSQATVVSLDAHRAARGAPEAWVRKAQVAEHLGVSTRTVERLMEGANPLPHKRVSRGLVLFRIGEVERWMEER